MECPACKEEIRDNVTTCAQCNFALTPGAVGIDTQPSAAAHGIVEQSPFSYYIACWRKFAVFSGRARRKEYWYFALFNLGVSILLGYVDLFLGTFNADAELGLFHSLYNLAALVPCVAVTVRRLHDLDRSGWWVLLGFVPIIGWIVLVLWTCLNSDDEPNQYGDNPKYAVA